MSNANIISPYNFVPLRREPNRQGGAHKEKEFTGVIEYSVYTKTKLFIPNTSIDKSEKGKKEKLENKHRTYDFFSYKDFSELKEKVPMPTGQEMPVIPGSEVRGMFRSYFEILTNSCMSAVTGEKILNKNKSVSFKPGLIKKNKDKYDLYEPEIKNLHLKHTRLVGGRIKYDTKWMYVTNVKKDKEQKYYIIEGFEEPDEKDLIAKGLSTEGLEEIIKGKKEIINRYDDHCKESFEKYAHNFENFKKTGSNWEYFPVSYGITDDKQYVLASIYQSGPRKLIDMIEPFHTCTDKNKLCPACSLFGIIKEGNDGFSEASRIRFTDLKCKRSSPKDCYDKEITMPPLMEPHDDRTNYYLHKPEDAVRWYSDYYIDKNGYIYFNGYSVNGRKFFWHNRHNMNENNKNEKPTKLNETIKPVKRGILFDGKLYFHNITKSELDQLIYLLDGGERNTKINEKKHGYKLGKYKPYGYGSIAVSVNKVNIRETQPKEGRVVREVSEYKEYTPPKFDGDIKRDFDKITNFYTLEEDELKGDKVQYPNPSKGTDEGKYYIESMRPEIRYLSKDEE